MHYGDFVNRNRTSVQVQVQIIITAAIKSNRGLNFIHPIISSSLNERTNAN